jgi:UDP-4-amino-4,6-dideoxy-N-acetyl-beta-L-altrosamine transaminase
MVHTKNLLIKNNNYFTMLESIPYGRQDINEDDIKAVIDVLNSEYITQGPAVENFEKKVTSYVNVNYAIAVNSATSALHIACLALELGPGDILWTSPITFVASANCAIYCGAEVDFVDIDLQTYNMSIDKLKQKLEEAEKRGKLPKILVPVHLCGQSCEMDEIKNLSKKYGFKIIEDASHGIGGSYKNKKIGNCEYSDITVFSFHPVKIITTGEGGMATTNNEILANRMRKLRSHGITSNELEMIKMPIDEKWNYQQIGIGFNYRMTDINAALGISQMNRIEYFINRRHEIANKYFNELSNLEGIILPFQNPNTYSSYHLYPIRLKAEKIKITQIEAFKKFIDNHILVNLHYIPVYRQPFYSKFGFKMGYCENAEKYFKSVISIPMYSALSDESQNKVIRIIKDIFSIEK